MDVHCSMPIHTQPHNAYTPHMNTCIQGTHSYMGMLCFLLSFVFNLFVLYGKSQLLSQMNFYRCFCLYGSFGRLLCLLPILWVEGIFSHTVTVAVLVYFCFLKEKIGGSREAARKPELLQVGLPTCNAGRALGPLSSHHSHIPGMPMASPPPGGTTLGSDPFPRPCLSYSSHFYAFLKSYPLWETFFFSAFTDLPSLWHSVKHRLAHNLY